jgi:hypothetical protein
MNFSHFTTVKNVAVVAALGFLWFTFLAPEATNAARNGNFCLIAFFASWAFYNYQRFAVLEQQNALDSQERYNDERMNDLERRCDESANSSNKCCKK